MNNKIEENENVCVCVFFFPGLLPLGSGKTNIIEYGELVSGEKNGLALETI